MNLLTQLHPQVERVEPKPKKRSGRWERKRKLSKADRARQDEALSEEIKAKLAAWDRDQAQEQNDLLAKSATLPEGIKVVSRQEGQCP
jgi:hypothetical protein